MRNLVSGIGEQILITDPEIAKLAVAFISYPPQGGVVVGISVSLAGRLPHHAPTLYP